MLAMVDEAPKNDKLRAISVEKSAPKIERAGLFQPSKELEILLDARGGK